MRRGSAYAETSAGADRAANGRNDAEWSIPPDRASGNGAKAVADEILRATNAPSRDGRVGPHPGCAMSGARRERHLPRPDDHKDPSLQVTVTHLDMSRFDYLGTL
eukprot:5827382-Pleurochrysis_carterae.AAC.1